MKCIRHFLWAGALIVFAGCAHAPKATGGADVASSFQAKAPDAVSPHKSAAFISVYVGGNVNSPGKISVFEPFTIDHAIQQAGGLTIWSKDEHSVEFRRNDRMLLISKKNWGSFILADGDAIYIPRRY
jgi:protein involved in polysaccharide export with SLBB domain